MVVLRDHFFADDITVKLIILCDKYGNYKLKRRDKDWNAGISEDWRHVARVISKIYSHFEVVNLNKPCPRKYFYFPHSYKYGELSLFVHGLLNSSLKNW